MCASKLGRSPAARNYQRRHDAPLVVRTAAHLQPERQGPLSGKILEHGFGVLEEIGLVVEEVQPNVVAIAARIAVHPLKVGNAVGGGQVARE